MQADAAETGQPFGGWRQIASRLYVTISTIEQRLTRVYRKLQVAGRIDLPTSLMDSVPPF